MFELESCPFCGGKAELHESLFPTRSKTTCKTREEAIEFQKYFESLGVVAYSNVYMRERRHYGKWGVCVDLKAFTPRCLDIHCPGRGSTKYHFPDEASSAWNRRHTDA